MNQKQHILKARAIIPLFYSSVSNTSKKVAYMLQEKLESEHFIVTITNIGDVDYEQFLQLTGPAVFLMSTYGSGGSPADGQDFMEWITHLQKKGQFEHLEYAILGFGCRSFQHFCGNSKTLRETLHQNGAQELLELETCNSASAQENAYAKFKDWSDALINKLKQKFQIKDMEIGELMQKYKTLQTKQQIDDSQWLKQEQQWQKKLGKQFLSYHKSHKADVIHIKQLRQKDDGRSTLWVRIAKPPTLHIDPACNISIFPRNVRVGEQKRLQGSVIIENNKKNGKVAYPPMRIQSLWEISNFNQFADLNIIKYALTVSSKPEQVKAKYAQFLKNPQILQKQPIRCWQVYEDLEPGLDFIVKLGINSVRPYTLASWDTQQKYMDLVISLDPLGLTSKYLKSRPTQLRILPTSSTFYVPSGRPVVMIANGSGIAPFRSLVQYMLKSGEPLPELYLYFGIQNKALDYYFGEEWQQLQKQNKIILKIAQSRAHPENKVYVQDLVKQDRAFFKKHLFEDKGVLFLCGSAAMAKSVDTQLFQAIKMQQPVPFKAFKLSTQLIKNKTIVKEIFG